MSALDEIDNFHAIDDRIGTAGQPRDPQLDLIAADGYAAVINLGLLDPRYCLADEAGRVAELGMQYVHIPVVFTDPRAEQLDEFVAAMDRLAGRRVFVHCAANWRVSTFMALFGELRLGWTRERADAHAREFWDPNELWTDFLRDGRSRLLGG